MSWKVTTGFPFWAFGHKKAKKKRKLNLDCALIAAVTFAEKGNEDRDGGHWQKKEVQQNGQLARKGNGVW